MITVYTLAYNESLLIQFMIDHYRSRFPGCHIVIYDNSSTDNTVEIAKANGCEIRTYDSGGTLNDGLHMRIKNSCWKDAKTDWVLVCDLDELLDINEEQLKQEEALGNTKIKTEGWTLVNMEDNYDFKNMKYGVRDIQCDKDVLFNKKHIQEINYGAGCHKSFSIGNIQYSQPYILYHYKHINVNLNIFKYQTTAKRLSEENKKNGWGLHCLWTEQQMIDYFNEKRKKAIKIL